MDTSEIYISLGVQRGVHYYIHTIYSANEFKPDITYQIYNVLINQRVITDVNDTVVIYEINPIHKLVNVVTIQHQENATYIKFNKAELETAFPALLRTKIPTTYVIKYYYNDNGYRTYLINVDPNLFDTSMLTECHIHSINEVMTSKDIPSL